MIKHFYKYFHFLKLRIVVSFFFLCQATSFNFLWGKITNNPENIIWEYELNNFSFQQYNEAVHALFNTYEKTSPKKLSPGEKGKAGLKIYTGSGLGLCTPKALVLAVIQELEMRGFKKENIFIIDETTYNLRNSGFLPELSQGGDTFYDVPVYALDQNTFWDEEWFYTASLPSWSTFNRFLMKKPYSRDSGEKSYLPVPLLLDTDFWINLPVVTSCENIGVNGALANATIFNVSNNKRFIINSVHGSIAIAEIAAIPEIQESWIFTLLSLERYQFVGGSIFNYHYTRTEPLLWLSTNATAIDYLMFQKINKARQEEQIKTFKSPPDFFDYCKTLKVGNYEDRRIVKIQSPNQ